MDAHAWISLASILVALLSIGLTVWFASRSNLRLKEREMGALIEKVDTMWDAFLASGITKGMAKGMVEMNSPVRLVGNSAELMEGLRVQLETFRKTDCPDCSEKELALKIAAKFKEPIMQICAPNGLQFEVGVVIATAVANGKDTLAHILDEYIAPKLIETELCCALPLTGIRI